MCGIGLIVSGTELVETEVIDGFRITVDHLVNALRNRGPDSIGKHTVLIKVPTKSTGIAKHVNYPTDHAGNIASSEESATYNPGQFISTQYGGDDLCAQVTFDFVGTLLQLRGVSPVVQPFKDPCGNVLIFNGEIFGGLQIEPEENDAQVLFDSLSKCCACLCHTDSVIMHDCSCFEQKLLTAGHLSIPDVLSSMRGPWSLIYWQAESKSLWFGRDALGRRSLLVHWPSEKYPQFVLSSVAPLSNTTSEQVMPLQTSEYRDCQSHMFSSERKTDAASETEKTGDVYCMFDYWQELPCGIQSICIGKGLVFCKSGLVTHSWRDPSLIKMVNWERHSVNPEFCDTGRTYTNKRMLSHTEMCADSGHVSLETVLHRQQFRDVASTPPNQEVKNCNVNHQKPCEDFEIPESHTSTPVTDAGIPMHFLAALKESVRRRTANIIRHERAKLDASVKLRSEETDAAAQVAVLFSGGLDSMILAALADQCLPSHCTIDLLNVSFEGKLAPDRVTALAGFDELCSISPTRRWRLVEVDGELLHLSDLRSHLLSLICPSKTHMDLNIGTALWLAASGYGWVKHGSSQILYKSVARVLLVGTGADEQCAGYGRHRTKFREGGWEALDKEMRLDMQRLWQRNLGRDDRCIADHGTEARFPFLDEDVILALLDLPLWEVTDLREPLGKGDKRILREVALHLGLKSAASLPKRAIQFGSRIAQESNRINFGSNRAANQASAGSAILENLQN